MGLVVQSSCRAADKPMNVVFILADDLGWADTTLYGHTKYHQTPNLNRLAQRGMVFTRAYSASPLCSPTRSAILTGLSPARTGITTPSCHVPEVVLEASIADRAAADQKSVQPRTVTRLKTEFRTLAEALKDAGYATGHFGKWHLGREPYSPLQHGFDVDLPHHSGPGPAGSYVAPWKFENFDPDPDVPDQHIEDRMAKEASQWMEANRDRPFFLNYWMFSVHAPFDAKKDLIAKHTGRVDPSDEQKCPTYAAMIESMDDAVGTLLDTLDRLQLSERTIVVFTSDNGGNMYSDVNGVVPTSNRPLRGGKASMFEGGTRVPCVVSWPGVAAPGSRSEAPVQSEDYFPTLLDGLGLSPVTDQIFDGQSILPALRGEPMTRDGVVQFFPHSPRVPEWLPPSVSIHRDHWKLIRIFHGGDNGAHRYLLFDLSQDVSEKNNLADQNPDVVKLLDGQISAFLQKTNAVIPIANPAFDPLKYRPEDEGKPRQERKPARNAKQAASTAPTTSDNDPALKGWKLRGLKAIVRDGSLIVSERRDNSFLGFAAGRHQGESTVSFRVRGEPGEAHIDWLPDGPQGEARRVHWSKTNAGWEDVSVKLSATGKLGVVRIYIPGGVKPMEFDWIQISSTAKDDSRSDF